MADRKNQHYVPQFYLRKFSMDTKSINIYLIKNRKTVNNASISGQCARDYFYGKNLKVETGLGELENAFSNAINRFCEDNYIQDDKVAYYLNLFISIQHARTAKMNDFFKESMRFAFQSIFDLYIEKNGDDLRLNQNIKVNDIVNTIVAHSIIYSPLLRDLSIHKITNQSKIDFVTCDNPVVIVNPVFCNNPETIGLGLGGIQIILVLSPKNAVFLYDQKYYSPLLTGNKNEAKIKEDSVIDRINKMIAFNAYEIIIKSSVTSEDYVKSLLIDTDHGGLKAQQINEISDIGDGKIKQRIGTIPTKMPTEYSKGYYIPKYKKYRNLKEKYRRDPVLASILDLFDKEVKDGNYKVSQFEEFLLDSGQ